MSFTKIYNVGQITLIVAGIPIDSGLPDDGNFVKIERIQPEVFGLKVGADGQGTRFQYNNNYVKLTVRLAQTSDGNAKLSALHTLDVNTPGGAGVGPSLVRDRQGTSLYGMSESWIAQPPDPGFGTEPEVREWIVYALLDARLDGGN